MWNKIEQKLDVAVGRLTESKRQYYDSYKKKLQIANDNNQISISNSPYFNQKQCVQQVFRLNDADLFFVANDTFTGCYVHYCIKQSCII